MTRRVIPAGGQRVPALEPVSQPIYESRPYPAGGARQMTFFKTPPPPGFRGPLHTFRPSGPFSMGEAKEIINIQAGGEIITTQSRIAGKQDAPEMKKALEAHRVGGINLKEWRASLMGLRDFALVKWPNFVRNDLPKYLKGLTPAQLGTLLKRGDSIGVLYDDSARYYDLAQREYDALMPKIEQIITELEEMGLSGLGLIATGTILIIIAICAAITAASAATYKYFSAAGDAVDDLMEPHVIAAQTAKGYLNLTKERFDKLDELIVAGEIGKEEYTTLYPQNVKMGVQGQKTIEKLTEEATKTAKEAAKIAPKSVWAYLPWIGLAIVGIIVAPSVKQAILGYTPKRKGAIA